MTIMSMPPEEKSTVERVWGARCGDHCYLAHVLVLPLGNNVPPEWMTFDFEEPPSPAPSTLDPAEVLFGARGHVAALHCALLDVELVETTQDDYLARAQTAMLQAAEQTVERASGPLTSNDFATPPPPPRPRKRRRR